MGHAYLLDARTHFVDREGWSPKSYTTMGLTMLSLKCFLGMQSPIKSTHTAESRGSGDRFQKLVLLVLLINSSMSETLKTVSPWVSRLLQGIGGVRRSGEIVSALALVGTTAQNCDPSHRASVAGYQRIDDVQ